jgi:hypothetical protein
MQIDIGMEEKNSPHNVIYIPYFGGRLHEEASG